MIEYDAHEWRTHLLDIRGSMVREITGRVSVCVLWSAAVVAFDRYVTPVGIPSTAHSLVGLALGLLLVFRTNASYDRFWEGRKLWGGIINESRNLARSARSWLKEDARLCVEVINWTAAFPFAVMHHLRDAKGLGPSVERLPQDEVAAILQAPHPPLAIASRATALLAEARDRGMISDYLLGKLDQDLQLLIDYLGGCERIHRTPLPFVYVVHLRRALILYCFTLPFALVGDYGWAAVLDTLFVAFIFFGIEEIGVEIEDPFGLDVNDLPLEAMCARIDADLQALAADLEEGVGRPVVEAS